MHRNGLGRPWAQHIALQFVRDSQRLRRLVYRRTLGLHRLYAVCEEHTQGRTSTPPHSPPHELVDSNGEHAPPPLSEAEPENVSERFPVSAVRYRPNSATCWTTATGLGPNLPKRNLPEPGEANLAPILAYAPSRSEE